MPLSYCEGRRLGGMPRQASLYLSEWKDDEVPI